MRKILLTLTAVMLLSIFIIATLYYYTTQKSFLNNFVRKFPPHPILPQNAIDIRYSSFYFAGASGNRIFLGNGAAPYYVFSANDMLQDTMLVKMKIEDQPRARLLSAQLAVYANKLYLLDGVTPAVYESLPQEKSRLHTKTGNKKVYFTQAVPYGTSSLAIRTLDGKTRQSILGRTLLTDSVPFKPAAGILEKQIDGIFCTDGHLLYDSAAARFVYIYLYRNQFICMDTSMDVLYRANTIDTISHARIKVGTVKSENAIKLASPAMTVNRLSCVYQDWLFVNSNITADNENREAAAESSVIDVYGLKDGQYKFSFYVFNIGRKKPHSIYAAHGKFYSLHEHQLVAYKLNPRFFSEPKN